jgi:hypothetical protein
MPAFNLRAHHRVIAFDAGTAGSWRARRFPPPVPGRSAYYLSLPRPTNAQPHLVCVTLPLQRSDPRLQTSQRRNLSLQPSQILPHPVSPLDLVHVLISVSLRRGFVPLSRRRQAVVDRYAPGLRRGPGRGGLADVYDPAFANNERRPCGARIQRRALPNRDTWATRTVAVRAHVGVP